MSLHYLVKLEIFIAHVRDITKKRFVLFFPHTPYMFEINIHIENMRSGVSSPVWVRVEFRPKCILVNSEPMKRVWWLQMSSVSDERNLKIEILRGNRYTSR